MGIFDFFRRKNKKQVGQSNIEQHSTIQRDNELQLSSKALRLGKAVEE